MHSSTSRLPSPRPRAEGSTISKRSWAADLDCLTTSTAPTRSPPLSALQQRTRRVARARIEHGERLAPLGGEGEEALPAVVRCTPCAHQAAALEALQQPAEIAEVEAEVPA